VAQKIVPMFDYFKLSSLKHNVKEMYYFEENVFNSLSYWLSDDPIFMQFG
jgi:hypothetical protein